MGNTPDASQRPSAWAEGAAGCVILACCSVAGICQFHALVLLAYAAHNDFGMAGVVLTVMFAPAALALGPLACAANGDFAPMLYSYGSIAVIALPMYVASVFLSRAKDS